MDYYSLTDNGTIGKLSWPSWLTHSGQFALGGELSTINHCHKLHISVLISILHSQRQWKPEYNKKRKPRNRGKT